MINQVNLADIRSFVLIAKLGSFTKAADALDVSRSHISRQLSQLEKRLGVTLVLRTTRSLRLTEAGQAFSMQCQQALNHIDQALLAAVDNAEAIRGPLNINCVGGLLGEELIASIATEFISQHPDIQLNMVFSSHRVDLIEEEFDIAIRMGKLPDASFVARKLMSIKMTTLASPEYLARYGRPVHPKALKTHRCLTGSVKQWSFIHTDNKPLVDVHVQGHLQCKNGRVLVKGALAHQGIIRVPELYCQEEIKAGLLVEVFDQWRIADVDLSAIYRKDKYQPARVKAFLDLLLERLRQN